MRFCMLTTFYPPYHHGGDATYVRALSEGLVQRGHRVTVLHCEDAYRLAGAVSKEQAEPKQERAPGAVEVRRLKSRLGFLSPLITQQTGRPGLKSGKLKAALSEHYDVVHFHNISLIGGPGVIALSRAEINLYTMHEHWLVCPTHILWKNRSHACDKEECLSCCIKSGIPPQLWRKTGLLERNLKRIDRFLAPSEFTKQRHRAAGIGHPIDVLPLFSHLAPEEHRDQSEGAMRFLFVGRVTASKGIASLVRSFARWPELELHVVGEGDQLASLRQELAGQPQIHFHGKLPQAALVELYRRSTALILPSLAPETFGLTVVEAFACGLPAIVRSAGGNREALDASGAGFVYQTEAELAAAIARFQADPKLRTELGAKAREAYSSMYTKEQHIDSYLRLVESLQREKALARELVDASR